MVPARHEGLRRVEARNGAPRMIKPPSNHPINDPEHWRGRAEEARTLADQMGDQGAKQTMLRIAEDYDTLAERAVKRLRQRK